MPRRGLRWVGAVAAFVVAWVTVTVIVDRLAPWVVDGAPGSQLRMVEQVEEPLDVVVVGSSLVRNGIDPAVLDEVLGDDLRVLNVGLPGMTGWELLAAMEWILDTVEVETLVFGPSEIGLPPKAKVAVTQQSVAFHDPRTMFEQVRTAVRVHGVVDSASEVAERLRPFGVHVTGQGRFHQETPSLPPPIVDRGYRPLNINEKWGPRFRQRREPFVRSGRIHRRELRTLRQIYRTGGLQSRSDERRFVRRAERLAERHGVELVWLQMPLTGRPWLAADDLGAQRPVLDYAEPRRFPELYDADTRLEVWFDRRHLAPMGAKIVTRQLADDLAELGVVEGIGGLAVTAG